MKKVIFLIFICSLSISSLLAQNEQKKDRTFGYFNKTELGCAFGVGSFKTDIYQGIQKTVRNDEIVFSLQTVNGIAYHGRVGLGFGVGAEMWQHGWFFPLFGQLYYDVKPAGNTFYGNLSLGGAIGKRDSTTNYHQGTGGVLVQVGIGYKMKVFKRLHFQYELFYKYQAVYSNYNTWVNDSIPPLQTDYKVPNHFVGFRIGISYY